MPYGVNLLMNVDQLPSAARVPGPWLEPPHVPSKLSPVPPTKNGPPQSVYEQAWAMYSLAIQIELPSTAAARCAPPSGLSAVSSAPHNLPFAYVTCCMRVSLESGREITSLCAGSPPKSRRQQPKSVAVT